MEAPAFSTSADSSPGDLQARARAVAVIAASNAVDVDSAARFPSEACAALKQQRLLGVMVSRDLGGEGASIADVADICYVLGQACSSTAMVYAMHQIKVACVTRHMRDNPVLADTMRRLCAEQLLLASSTTEGQSGGNVRSSEAPVEYDGDSIQLERKASVISYGAYADGIVTTARRSAEAVGSDQVLVAFLKSDYTLTRLQGWNTLGMRGTCSEGYTLKATGKAAQILPDPYEIIHAQTMVPFAHLLWGSVWTGIAANATARAQAFIRAAMRGGSGQLPPGAPQFTKALASLRTLRGMLSSSLRAYERSMNDPKAIASVEFQSLITMTKVEASEHAVGIVLSAMRACGLSGYRSDGDFTIGRHLRDVLSSPIMINNDRILANLATSSLMTPIPASMRD
jgi:acyl-CoA dehydrogenase